MAEERSSQPSWEKGLAALSLSSTLTQAAQVFELYMAHELFSTHTIKAFRGDLRLLGNYLGADRPIGRMATQDLNQFLHYMLYERGVPCNMKSYARRVTTLKVFFKWLHKGGVLPEDPAAAIVQHSVSTPLSEVLTEEEIRRALEVTTRMRQASKPDPRPHFLINLLLDTAIKKAECMALRQSHIVRAAHGADAHGASAPSGPFVQIRYDDPRKQTKERKIPLSNETLDALDDYLEVYQPADKVHPTDILFPCTPRNLEYVLTDVAEQAEIARGISFEMLRWTAAVRDSVGGMDDVRLRQKLGISEVTWQTTGPKIKTLSEGRTGFIQR